MPFRKNRTGGMVLLTVLMAIIILSLYFVNVLGTAVSHSLATQDRVHQIQAQELALGAYWKVVADQNAGALFSVPPSESLYDDQATRVFTVGVSTAQVGGKISISTTVSYP